ncbi:MAG TPA: tRNA (adenosine(37)-N6)-threonylcarbamoyltransferase complex ATPase subunit type 1 TsaE [Trebonia sp.]|nr:tRNA (adenosine(37)-N6)-threonylcarbamoyltransferase complex ATPase subunit type 1 TsaE [Trebonia sp.]
MTSRTEVSLTVPDAAAMRALGESLAQLLRAGDLVILSGGLGAGKTTLTQGIGAGLGVRGPVTSPTFVIARVHPPAASADRAANLAAPRPPLVHADAYRLGSALELDDLDLDTDTAASVTVVEWGEGLAEGLAADRLEIVITPETASGSGGAGPADLGDAAADVPRTVRITAIGERWEGVQMPLANLVDRL